MNIDLDALLAKYHPLALELIEKDVRTEDEEKTLDIDHYVRDAIWRRDSMQAATDQECIDIWKEGYERTIKELEKLLS